MEFVLDSFRADWEAVLGYAPRLVYAAFLFGVFAVIGSYAGRLARTVLGRSPRFRTNQRFLSRLFSWLFVSAGLLLALSLLGFTGIAASMLATGGVVAIVLGFAFREIGENILAGFFLSFSRPFELGDLIQTGEFTGTVRAIEWRYVHLRTADASDVFVPSAQIFGEPVTNFTRDGLRRPSFTVGVAYHDQPERVLALLEGAVKSVPEVAPGLKPFVTIRAFGAQVVEYEVFFFVDLNQAGRDLVATSNSVKTNCWRALRDAGMTFSSDVSSALEIQTVAPVAVELADARAGG